MLLFDNKSVIFDLLQTVTFHKNQSSNKSVIHKFSDTLHLQRSTSINFIIGHFQLQNEHGGPRLELNAVSKSFVVKLYLMYYIPFSTLSLSISTSLFLIQIPLFRIGSSSIFPPGV